MKAIVQRLYGAADVLQIEDIDKPDVRDDDVRRANGSIADARLRIVGDRVRFQPPHRAGPCLALRRYPCGPSLLTCVSFVSSISITWYGRSFVLVFHSDDYFTSGVSSSRYRIASATSLNG